MQEPSRLHLLKQGLSSVVASPQQWDPVSDKANPWAARGRCEDELHVLQRVRAEPGATPDGLTPRRPGLSAGTVGRSPGLLCLSAPTYKQVQ